MAKLPSVLVDMNAFLLDESFAGLVNKTTLPKIVTKMAETALSGTAGAVERSLGRLEKMEMEVTISDYHPTIKGLVGSNAGRSEVIVLRGALDQDGSVVPVVVRFSGFWKDTDLGEWTPEKELEIKSNVAVEHFELEVAGRELVFIDKMMNIWRMNGVDRNKEIRAALGQ